LSNKLWNKIKVG